jgi:hypothetical protein
MNIRNSTIPNPNPLELLLLFDICIKFNFEDYSRFTA